MAKTSEKITLNVTPAQKAAAEQVANGEPVSRLLKRLLADYCAAQGVEFPIDESGWGGKRENAGAKSNRP